MLRAALRSGLGMAYECNAGSCSTCKFELVSGDILDLWPEAPGIRQRERDRGRRLACQCIPLEDCVIRARLDEVYKPEVPPTRMTVRLDGWRDITRDIRHYRFRSDQPARFLAGQYAMLHLPGLDSPRAYSMSNIANDGGLWEFMIRRVEGGKVSKAVFDLAQGDAIALDGPFGLAYLRPESERDIVCIGGGSGIAPMVSILEAASRLEHARDRALWLFYGGRGPRDVPSLPELISAPCIDRQVRWHPVLSEPALAQGNGWDGDFGLVHEILPRKLARSLAAYEYYLAGPPPMIEALVRLLIGDNNVPPSQLHFDRFF